MRARIAVALLTLGCDVESTAEPSGGIDVVGDELCPGGVATVLSDYQSTEIALLDLNGQLLSKSFASSGATAASGTAAPLSGDVVVPSNRIVGAELVLLDRFGTNVITWIETARAEVRAQLPVGNGFESNPYDYLELSPSKAYVARFGENPGAGGDLFERGGDLLIVDPSTPAITGVIALPRESDFPPRPVSITPFGGSALVVLQRLALDFKSQGPSEIVAVDSETDEIAWQLVLDGLLGCGRVMVSPSGETMALGCTGAIDPDGNLQDAAASGIVLLDATSTPPEEIRRISPYDALGFSPQPEIDWATENLLLGKTQTPLRGQGNNQLFALDVGDDSFRVLGEAAPDDDGNGTGLVFGSLFCAPSCSDVCLLADQQQSSVRRFSIGDDFAELAPLSLGADKGLPPVDLGPF